MAAIRGRLTSHCLLIETRDRLVLVDTGYGLRDVANPRSRLSRFFLMLNSPELREEMTAVRQIAALGYDPRDVRDIVLSHLDFDHGGGLDDFPGATVHLFGEEASSARAQRTVLDRMRYRPQQWSTSRQWTLYSMASGEPWFGFEHAHAIPGFEDEILLVPLVGHTLGHGGVAVRRGSGWLFAADAYFYHAEMDVRRPRCTRGLRFYQTLMEKDRRLRLLNQRRLRNLRREQDERVTIFCAHDVRSSSRSPASTWRDRRRRRTRAHPSPRRSSFREQRHTCSTRCRSSRRVGERRCVLCDVPRERRRRAFEVFASWGATDSAFGYRAFTSSRREDSW